MSSFFVFRLSSVSFSVFSFVIPLAIFPLLSFAITLCHCYLSPVSFFIFHYSSVSDRFTKKKSG